MFKRVNSALSFENNLVLLRLEFVDNRAAPTIRLKDAAVCDVFKQPFLPFRPIQIKNKGTVDNVNSFRTRAGE